MSRPPTASLSGGPVMDAAPNLPNAMTLASLGLGAWWAAGGPDWAALVSVALDELDGRVARATGQTSEFGSLYDWGSDLVLTALAMNRVGAPWQAVPVVTTAQILMRQNGTRPSFGSARAAVMVYGVARNKGYIGR